MNIGIIWEDGFKPDDFERYVENALDTIADEYDPYGDLSYTLVVPEGDDEATKLVLETATTKGWDIRGAPLYSVPGREEWDSVSDEFLSDLDALILIGCEFPVDIAAVVAEELSVTVYDFS